MKANIKFLIHICNLDDGKIKARCTSIPLISEIFPSQEQAINDLTDKLSVFLENEAKSYLSGCQGNEGFINCPEGKIISPVDIWYCKLTDTSCPTQAQVLLTNKEQFFSKCLADDDRKNAIYDTIENGKYMGAHQKVGRVICSLCYSLRYPGNEDKPKKNINPYYYHFELYSLNDYFDADNDDFRRDFLMKGIDPRAYNPMCAECFIEVVSKIDSNIVNNFFKKEMDYFYD